MTDPRAHRSLVARATLALLVALVALAMVDTSDAALSAQVQVGPNRISVAPISPPSDAPPAEELVASEEDADVTPPAGGDTED